MLQSSRQNAKVQEEARRRAIDRCLEEINSASDDLLQGRVDRSIKRVETLTESIKKSKLDHSGKQEIMLRAGEVELMARQKRIDELLEAAMDCARRNDPIRRDEMLAKIRADFARVVALGTGEEFRDNYRRRVDILNQTTAAGTSERARNQVVTWQQADGANRSPTGSERRRFYRYTEPVLEAVIEGKTYPVDNWSIGGVIVQGYEGRGRQGPLTIILRDPETKEEFPDTAELVARDNLPEGHSLFRYQSNNSVILKLISQMKFQDREPR